MKTTTHELAARTRGPVYVPGADGYDDERTGFQLLGPHRPEVVVGATDVEDIRAALTYATEHRLPLAVQASGHGVGAPVQGVLISTRRMNDVNVDPQARTAWVEPGATWAQVIKAAAPHGLAPLSGSFPGVGAVPYTLGGGTGLLARRYGYAADHVRRLDVLTLDGSLHQATATSGTDLFWALRGGGGDLGVVTGMEIDLMPVARIFGGALFFEVKQFPGVLEAWARWTGTVPDEMTSAVTMLPYPDIPVIPEHLRGRHIAQIQIAYAGPGEEGRRLVEPLCSLAPSLRDTLRELPYIESGSIFDEPDQPHPYRSQSRLLSALDPQALTELTRTAGPSAPMMTVVGLRHLGGALARPPHAPNAVGHRDAAYSVTVLSMAEPGQEETARAHHHGILTPFAAETIGRSLNFSYGPLNEDEVRSAFDPDTYRRLTRLKTKYDPQALLRSSHPIPGASD